MPISVLKDEDKDKKLIDSVHQIMEGVQTENPEKIMNSGKSFLTKDYVEEFLMADLPTEGRILVEEYPKMIHLNNEDTKKFDSKYWTNHLKVDSDTLRNIFNYVYVPVVEDQQVSDVLMFKDFELAERRRLIEAMTVLF